MEMEDIKKKLQKEIDVYKKNSSNVKSYSQSMDNLNKWLSEIKK